jgi:hypothetical protein
MKEVIVVGELTHDPEMVERDGSEDCVLWIRSRKPGYGSVRVEAKGIGFARHCDFALAKGTQVTITGFVMGSSNHHPEIDDPEYCLWHVEAAEVMRSVSV